MVVHLKKKKSTKKQKPGIVRHQNKGCVFPELLAWAAPELHLVGLSVGERQVGGRWVGEMGGGCQACLPQLLQIEVRCDGGCRGREGTGRRNATAATAPLPPWSSLPALKRKDKGHCA